ncbi:hypothetical protein D6U18_06065 [Lactiplantibacillus pentosus]|uniref:Uncharacterized protein n=1 Tax=Lactiplantibacillus pentosus TaxID=1589 RepID=A0ABD7IQV0_LACPE|nr:hypothetical protein D6U18_06065 [Lactiplantibacillus pentosus]
MTETALDEMANRANRATQGKLAIETKNRGAPPQKIVVRYYHAPILAEKKSRHAGSSFKS